MTRINSASASRKINSGMRDYPTVSILVALSTLLAVPLTTRAHRTGAPHTVEARQQDVPPDEVLPDFGVSDVSFERRRYRIEKSGFEGNFADYLETEYRRQRAIGTAIMCIGATTLAFTPLVSSITVFESEVAFAAQTVIMTGVGVGLVTGGSIKMHKNGKRLRALRKARKRQAIERVSLKNFSPILSLETKTLGINASFVF
jgi:hypothetical protein